MTAARAVRHAPLELRGKRVLLRSLTENDFAAWHEVRTRCAELAAAVGAPAQGRARRRRRTGPASPPRCGIRERERHLGTGYGFGIFVGERFAGEVTLSSIQRGPFQSAFIGYWVDEALAGRGLVPEAVVVTLRFAFEAISLHRVEISIIPRNTASRRVVEKLGIREEGVALRFLEIDGEWEDHVRYAITAEEWAVREQELVAEWLETERQASRRADDGRRVAEELLHVVLVGVRRGGRPIWRRSRTARMNVCTAPALVALYAKPVAAKRRVSTPRP